TCQESQSFNKPPKNIKNMLCINSKVRVRYTEDCYRRMAPQNNCKRNDIWTSLCGAGFGTNVVPACIYRTGDSGFASWTWWLAYDPQSNGKDMLIGCEISNYSPSKK